MLLLALGCALKRFECKDPAPTAEPDRWAQCQVFTLRRALSHPSLHGPLDALCYSTSSETS